MTENEMTQLREMLSEVLDARMGTINKRFDAVDEKFGDADRRFDAVDEKFDTVDKRFDAVDERLVRLENEQVRQGLLLENEVFPSLQLLAEGHGDVIRRLDKMDADIDDLKKGLLVTQIKVAGSK